MWASRIGVAILISLASSTSWAGSESAAHSSNGAVSSEQLRMTAEAASAVATAAQAVARAASAVETASQKQTSIGVPESPLVVHVSKTLEEVQQDAREHADRAHTDSLMIALTGVLALFTVALAVATAMLWVETSRLRKAAFLQSNDMRESINLARRAAETAEALELPIFVIENSDNPSIRPRISVKLGNHGRTPAVMLADCLVIDESPALAAVPRYPMDAQERVMSSRIVERGHPYEVVRNSAVSGESVLNLLKGSGHLWAYGYVEYLDFLKHKRVMGFCVALERVVHPVYPASVADRTRWVLAGPSSYTYDRPSEDPFCVREDDTPTNETERWWMQFVPRWARNWPN
jgi:hypothetical protein